MLLVVPLVGSETSCTDVGCGSDADVEGMPAARAGMNSGHLPIPMVTSWLALAGSIIGAVGAVWFWKLSASLLWQIQLCCLGDGTGAHLQYLQTEKLLAETKQVAGAQRQLWGALAWPLPVPGLAAPHFWNVGGTYRTEKQMQYAAPLKMINFYTLELKSSQAISSFSRLTSRRVSLRVTLCR